MANTLKYKEETFNIGDTVTVAYKVKEAENKYRIQKFTGILTQAKGNGENKMFTVRKIGAMNIGIERIFPVTSPFIDSITLVRKTKYTKAKIPFLPKISVKETNRKLYKSA